MAKVLILYGFGINCEEESKYAFELAGAKQVDIYHINDLIKNKSISSNYEILCFPGGFSFGDDLGSGKAFANIVRNNLLDEINEFIEEKKLIIGICNGFQVLTNLNLLPGALAHNKSGLYIDKWVKLKINPENKSPWLTGVTDIELPIAHGEGNYQINSKALEELKSNNQIAFQYEENPNGSLENIASVANYEGRVIGIMPHPERAIFFTQDPVWTLKKDKLKRESKDIPEYLPAINIFNNAVKYCESLKSSVKNI